MVFRRRASLLLLVALVCLLAGPTSASTPFFAESIDPGGFVGTHVSLALDDNGTPHVAYWDLSNFFLMYATRTDGTWNTEIIQAAVFLGNEIAIAVDAQSVPHVAFHEFTGAGDALRYASRTGGMWSVENVDASGDNVGQFCALAIDSQGRPHISYYDVTNTDLKYAHKSGAWSTETVDTGIGIGRHTDIALDGSDRPHISYVDDDGEYFYATLFGSSWHMENVLGAAADAPTGIALSADGVPYIATTSGGFLTVATRTPTGWASVGGGSVTSGTTYDGGLAIDAAGRPHVAFRDVASTDLRYAVYDAAWIIEPVAQQGTAADVGTYSDLVLDPSGNPVIAYYDATHGDALYLDSGVRLSSALVGVTWPVGAQRTVEWRGAGTLDLFLSVDGGAGYQTLASGLTGGNTTVGGQYTFTVPHQPSRFCKLKLERASPFASTRSDSLFTIETDIMLLNFAVTRGGEVGGTTLSWATRPGPEDLAGYKLERRALGATAGGGAGSATDAGGGPGMNAESEWETLVELTRDTSYLDDDAPPGARYRLSAVNGLGQAFVLAERVVGPSAPLAAWPLPYAGGELSVSFAIYGRLGTAGGTAEVAVYDVRGRHVRTLASGAYRSGTHFVTWDGLDAAGRRVPPAAYFLRASSGDHVETLKILVVR